MLVPAMTNEEITLELIKDYNKIEQVQRKKLELIYHKDRKRQKIDRRANWPKEYMIQMPKSKNTWMIIFQKSPIRRKYSKPEDTIYNSVTWYYGPQGLRAFRPTKNYIEVFNAHLFNRYNERMDLHISRHADTIRRFFLNSGMLLQETISHNGREYMMSMCKEGAALGNYHDGSSRRRWLVHNTFITHDQMFNEQVEGKFKYLTNTMGKLTALIQERDLTKLDQMQEHITHLITHLDIVA